MATSQATPTTPKTKTFTLFRRLSPELRLRVWCFSDLNRCRNVQVQVTFSKACNQLVFKAITPIPATLHVCHESRALVIKNYEACLNKFSKGRCWLYVNFATDSLFIRVAQEAGIRNRDFSHFYDFMTEKSLLSTSAPSLPSENLFASRTTCYLYDGRVTVRDEMFLLLKSMPELGPEAMEATELDMLRQVKRSVSGPVEYAIYRGTLKVFRWDVAWEYLRKASIY